MEKVWIAKLCEKHQEFELGKAVGIKFMFTFRGVEVSVYFDGYDEKIPMLMLILRRGIHSSFVFCNVMEMGELWLQKADVASEIRQCLLVEDSYEDFLQRLYQELKGEEYVFRNYKADFHLKQLGKQEYKRSGIHMFFGGFEKGEMDHSYMKVLCNRYTLSWTLLQQLREQGITVRTVGKCKERKKLENELAKVRQKGIYLY